MKKYIAAVLSIAMVLSFASCGKKTTESGAGSGAGSTSIASGQENSSNATTREPNPAEKYVKHKIEKLVVPEYTDEDGEKVESEEIEFHMPEILIKSDYTDSVNKEIAGIFNTYKTQFAKDKATDCGGAEYIAYLVNDDYLSVVFIVMGPNDTDLYHVYNIDVKTGAKIDNPRIAQIAGVSDIRKAAMDALQTYYNVDENQMFKVENYKVVKADGDTPDEQDRAVEASFGEKYLNADMLIGLTDDGKIFFISEAETGAGQFFIMYDEKGNDLYDEDNPARVGYIYEYDGEDEAEGDDGEEGAPDDGEDYGE